MLINRKHPHKHECRLVTPIDNDPDLGPTYAGCSGDACAHFVWTPFVCDAAWRAAVKKCAEAIGDKSPNFTKAADEVNTHRAKWGLPAEPETGECGFTMLPRRPLV